MTGVQTCALPICLGVGATGAREAGDDLDRVGTNGQSGHQDEKQGEFHAGVVTQRRLCFKNCSTPGTVALA